MLVYGDAAWTVSPDAVIAAIRRTLAGLDRQGPGIERHSGLVAAFIEAGGLLQGFADWEFKARGGIDAPSAGQDVVMALLMSLAEAVQASWDSGFARFAPPPAGCVDALEAAALPSQLTIRRPEGYAFYAVYPEAFAGAAAALGTGPVRVLGIRSIGTGLAAMVASATGAPAPVTVRPVGPPFRRELSLSAELRAALGGAGPHTRFAIVDEGPGLSGSSFGAVADCLEDVGVSRERVHFFPSHGGDLGIHADGRHRARWARAPRPVVDFDTLVLQARDPAHRLESWIGDLVGPLTEPLVDLSGGAWRALHFGDEARWPASNVQQERRKYLARTATGSWLVKFAGLGHEGAAKLERARALAAAGFSPQPLGFRHGFLVERWMEGWRPLDSLSAACERLIAFLGAYLGFRARSFPARADAGASAAELWAMARHNAGEALGVAATALDRVRPDCAALGRQIMRVETDNRLQACEWIENSDGRLLKTDAVDHHAAHDLVGAQDIAWDVAGAIFEFDLSGEQSERLCRLVETESGQAVDRALLDFYLPCYLAFQLGSNTLSADALQGSPEEAGLRRAASKYAEKLERICGLR